LTFTRFSGFYSSFIISITSLRKLHIPPSCVVDDVEGGGGGKGVVKEERRRN
jgi:hypothetical protein